MGFCLTFVGCGMYLCNEECFGIERLGQLAKIKAKGGPEGATSFFIFCFIFREFWYYCSYLPIRIRIVFDLLPG